MLATLGSLTNMERGRTSDLDAAPAAEPVAPPVEAALTELAAWGQPLL